MSNDPIPTVRSFYRALTLRAGNAIETGKYAPSLALTFRMSALFGQPIGAIFSPEDSDETP